MQRTREDLEAMTHDELVSRVLELQDLLREGLGVRNALHRVLNDILKVKADEVGTYADAPEAALGPEEHTLKEAWARVRHAVANPSGAATMMPDIRGESEL